MAKRESAPPRRRAKAKDALKVTRDRAAKIVELPDGMTGVLMYLLRSGSEVPGGRLTALRALRPFMAVDAQSRELRRLVAELHRMLRALENHAKSGAALNPPGVRLLEREIQDVSELIDLVKGLSSSKRTKNTRQGEEAALRAAFLSLRMARRRVRFARPSVDALYRRRELGKKSARAARTLRWLPFLVEALAEHGDKRAAFIVNATFRRMDRAGIPKKPAGRRQSRAGEQPSRRVVEWFAAMFLSIPAEDRAALLKPYLDELARTRTRED